MGNAIPHGGTLVDRVLRGALRAAMAAEAPRMARVTLSPMAVSDLELIATGAFSPLSGFMTRGDYERVVEEMRLGSGIVWSLPVTLPASRQEADMLREGQEVALTVPAGSGGRTTVLGILQLAEKFTYDKAHEAQRVYGTTEERHPGVARLYAQGDVLLGGDIWLLEHPGSDAFAEFRHTPAQTRRMFASRGWQTVVGFQTRNPIHRAHEYIQKTALEITDGLFLHPLVGETKADDIPADVRMASYQALLRDYYPPERVILGVFPAAMRYAGPREAVFHALCRKNYGCSHFIVGRDHAGVGNFYGSTDAQRIFSDFAPGELGIMPLFFDNTFYCRKCGGIVSSKTCPHDPSHHVVFSGTQVRRMLEAGEMLPAEFTRPEVAQILMDGLRGRQSSDAPAALAGPAAGTPAPVAEAPTPPVADAPSAVQAAKVSGGHARNGRRKVFVVGLDCAEPSLVFDQWREELPTLNALMRGGTYGTLESIIPCITVPAWACMMSSRDPGELGIYGFHNRPDHSYERMTIATSASVREPLVWDVLGAAGRSVVTVGVPPAYPPKPVNGSAVGCFLTPSTERPYTYPAALGGEIRDLVGDYLVDVPNFRTEDKDYLLRQIYEMTEKRLTVIEHFMATKPWDFLMFVEIGVDRIHHGMWKYHDPTHPKHEPGNRYRTSIFDYYKMLDERIGRLLARLDDDTIVWVLSDHGAKKMDGGICLNEWLIREGYLTIGDRPKGLAPLEKVEVDWKRTKAWGGGGYYGRVFLNVEGREPHGVIPRGSYEAVRDELATKLEALTDPAGRPIGTKVFRPENLYRQVRGIPPDLIVYFGDLYWRSVGSIGFDGVHTFENDTGPDDANHAQFGMFICHDPRRPGKGRVEGAHIGDVGPTVLQQMGVDARDMRGRILDLWS